MTMQDLSSTVSFSPSFSFYASGDLVDAAVRVVRESESYYSVKADGDNDKEFEFETLIPLGDESFFHFPITTLNPSSDDDVVAGDRVTSKNLFYGGWSINLPISSPPQSHSSSDSDCSESMSPRRCFWSPIRSSARGDSLKMKSKSSSEPRRCRLKELLRRSHSDGSVSTSSAHKRCSFRDLLSRSHSDGGEGSSISTIGNGSPVVKGRNKTVSYKPVVDQRRKSYLPYRQDLIGVFAGMSRFRH